MEGRRLQPYRIAQRRCRPSATPSHAGTFEGARLFNHPLASWDVSKVTIMEGKYHGQGLGALG